MKAKILYMLFLIFCIFQTTRVESGFLTSKISQLNWNTYYQNQLKTQYKLEERSAQRKMINPKQLKELIDDTLENIWLDSPQATQLLLGTFAKESNLGYYIEQTSGPAQGIGQIEPETERYIWQWLDNKPELRNRVIVTTKISGPNPYHLKGNLIYNIAITRLKYLTIPEKLPDYNDIKGQAKYWKKYYNTELGRGKISEYINAYNRYVEGRI